MCTRPPSPSRSCRQDFDDPAARAASDHYVLQVHHLEERRDALEAQSARLAEPAPYQAPVQRLTCLRGISTLSAMVLLAELQDLRRFTHPRQRMSFVGLVPSEHPRSQSEPAPDGSLSGGAAPGNPRMLV